MCVSLSGSVLLCSTGGRLLPPELDVSCGGAVRYRGTSLGASTVPGQAILDRLLESGTQEVYKWVVCCRSFRTHP